MEAHPEPKVTSNKTYIGGAFLYSTDGFQYEEKNKDAKEPREGLEKIVEDRIGIGELKKEIAQKKQDLKKKKESKNEKPVLIPIRDTPVEPIPEPLNDNQKCERATQDQFEYFQSYISQREKERKFDDEEQLRLDMFVLQQESYRQKQQDQPTPTRGIALVMEKETNQPKKKMLLKIKIKKKVVVAAAVEKAIEEAGAVAKEVEEAAEEASKEASKEADEEAAEEAAEEGSQYESKSKIRVLD